MQILLFVLGTNLSIAVGYYSHMDPSLYVMYYGDQSYQTAYTQDPRMYQNTYIDPSSYVDPYSGIAYPMYVPHYYPSVPHTPSKSKSSKTPSNPP